MNKQRMILVLNVLLICAMVIHVSVKMYLHGQHPGYSSPVYVELINAVYYLIPLIIINIGNLVLKKR